MGRVEVLHQDEGHAAIRRQRTQKFPAGIEATRRGADANNGEVTDLGRRAARQGTPARSRAAAVAWSNWLSDILASLSGVTGPRSAGMTIA